MLVGAHFSTATLTDLVNSDAATMRAFVNAYVRPSDLAADGAPTDADLDRLEGQLATLRRPGEILRLELRRSDGTIVAASEPGLRGIGMPTTGEFATAAGGTPNAAIGPEAEAAAGPGSLGPATILREFLPLTVGGEVLGIVGIWRVPTPTPSPRPTPTASSSARPTATPTSSEAPRPSPSQKPSAAPSTGAGGGPIGPTTGGGTDPGPSTAPASEGPFDVGTAGTEAELDLDIGQVAFGGFEWAVPGLVLTVPGLLIVIIAAQAMIGVAWLPVARRWLGADRRRRRAARSA